ncbi:MAG: type II and III secretion system protein family protein [Acidobacteria bacterium]|nr:type II and III secretion system protein family protein [Acidobacteriota bacterium]
MNSSTSSRGITILAMLALATVFGLFATHEVAAQTEGGSSAGAADSPRALHLLVRRSLLISSPVRIKRISMADPNVVDAVVADPNQIVINAKSPGASSLVIWDENGQTQTFDVVVDLDSAGLREKIREALPEEPIDVQATREVVTLAGRVSSQEVADRAIAIAHAMLPKKEALVSLLQVPVAPVAPTVGQVLLQVKFAEVDRNTISQLGANWMSLPPAKNIFSVSTQQFGPPSLPQGQALTGSSGGFQLSDLLNLFIFRPDLDIAATIKLLQAENLLQILAEPNVLAETGKDATFLAGGEFPFPVVQNTSGGLPVITIMFREFGVRLNFTPVITPDGLIHLKVAPEVSSLDFSNAVSISGFTIPSLSTRKVESQMVLRDGQTFVIAGMLSNQVTSQFSKIPGIGDIPILGKLFQSRAMNKSRNELLVMVTPRIVRPDAPPPVPSEPQFPIPFLEAKPAAEAGKK